MRSRFHRSAHRYDFCFQYATFEVPVSQCVEESLQYEPVADGKHQAGEKIWE